MSGAGPTASLPAGEFTCLLRATPARIYDQFESFFTASLFYDFVLIDELDLCIRLHESGAFAKRQMHEWLSQVRDRGIGMDPHQLFDIPASTLNEAEFKAAFPGVPATPEERLTCNNKIARANALNERRMAVSEESRAGRVAAEEIGHMNEIAIGEYNEAAIDVRAYLFKLKASSFGYKVDDGGLLADSWNSDRNPELREILNAGGAPVATRPADLSAAIKSNEQLRTFQLVLRAIPFPSNMPIQEFTDFRNDSTVRKSIRAFRKIAGDLVDGQAPARNVLEQLLEGYEDYKKEVAKTKAKTTVSNARFIISSTAGLVEDIIKLRIESLFKRPFEIADFFIDRKFDDASHKKSPFFFLYEKDTSVPRLR